MENDTFISYINFREKLGLKIDYMYYLELKNQYQEIKLKKQQMQSLQRNIIKTY